MSASVIQTVWTVIAFVIFVGIVIWAWSSKRKKAFDEASKLPVDLQNQIAQELIDEIE